MPILPYWSQRSDSGSSGGTGFCRFIGRLLSKIFTPLWGASLVAEVRRKFFTKIPPWRVMLTSQHGLSLRSCQGNPTTQRPPLYPRRYHLNEHHESRCERCSTVDPAKILLNYLTSCLRTS